MRMKMGKVQTLLLAGAMILSAVGLTGCFKSSTKVDDQTIRIMLMGNKPIGFEEVLADANCRSKEEIGIKASIEMGSTRGL